ncbi:hypothetical protein SELMODRAFT_427077 [Selaginella moellendorffii]|uniref:Uncharacterized protein n=1 Tax=Selaginella moellendorffii TaxID=88036 RepID=D8SYF9_SELML|nr:hypothetical protein SELMODRAFT_427077 [Selaginella moellendorffii]
MVSERTLLEASIPDKISCPKLLGLDPRALELDVKLYKLLPHEAGGHFKTRGRYWRILVFSLDVEFIVLPRVKELLREWVEKGGGGVVQRANAPRRSNAPLMQLAKRCYRAPGVAFVKAHAIDGHEVLQALQHDIARLGVAPCRFHRVRFHNDEVALIMWLDYVVVEDKKNATDEVEEVEDLHEAVRAVIISQQRAELEHNDEDYGSKVISLIQDHQESLYLVMKTLPEHLSTQWVSALATVAEAEILLAAGDTDILSTAKLRDKLAKYSRWDMRFGNQGEQVFHSLFLTPVLLDGAPREVEAGPSSHQLLSPGASTSRVHTLEPPFRRSQIRRLLDDGASPLKERLAILEDLGFSYSFTYEFRDVFEVGKVFVQKQLSALEKIYEQYKTKTS